ncbi:MAG: hypothetical protein ABWX92_00665 [Mycetocola sp.]
MSSDDNIGDKFDTLLIEAATYRAERDKARAALRFKQHLLESTAAMVRDAEAVLGAVAALASYTADVGGDPFCTQCGNYVLDCDRDRGGFDCDMAKVRAVLADAPIGGRR